MKKRIVLCAALPQEVNAFLRPQGKRISQHHPDRLQWNLDPSRFIVLLTSGVGFQAMQRALNQVEPCQGESVWLSCGFAGGLKETLHAGDVLSGNRVIHHDRLLETLPAFVLQNEPCLLCRQHAAVSREEKRSLGTQFNADLVDMESAAVALHAIQRSEPFGWLRVVSDPVDQALPLEILSCMHSNGFPSISKSIKTLARNPRVLPSFLRMALRTKRLSQNLGQALPETIREV